jgi:hypothetical protein
MPYGQREGQRNERLAYHGKGFSIDRDDGYRDGQYAARILFVPWRKLTDLKANRKRPTFGQKPTLTPKRVRISTSPRNEPAAGKCGIVINSCKFGESAKVQFRG